MEYYCQKHQDGVIFNKNGEVIGILPCKKQMKDKEVCADCFTESKKSEV